MKSSIMNKFCLGWAFKEGTQEDLLIEETNNSFRIIVHNKCTWMNMNSGCTMCNYSSRFGSTAGDIIKKKINNIVDTINQSKSSFSSVQIYTNGSFFSEQEIDRNVQFELLSKLRNKCNIRYVKLETRPEYIAPHFIEKIVNDIGVHLEVAIGLETVSDKIRKKCINKGFTYSQFLQAARQVKNICKIKTYLLFKPPFLSEKQAVNDILSSIEQLLQDGFENISITPLSVQKNTLIEFLLQEHLYRPPWLWSLVELNTQLRIKFPKHTFSISGLDYFPKPVAKAFNCELCSKDIYNKLAQVGSLRWDQINKVCKCKDEWLNQYESQEFLSIDSWIEKASRIFDEKLSRSNKISETFSSQPKSIILNDTAKECPEDKISLDSVYVENVPINLKLSPINFKSLTLKNREPFLFATGSCKAGIDLDEFHRGIHMSRIISAIESFSNETHLSFREDSKKLLFDIIKNQNSKQGFVKIKVQSLLPIYFEETKRCSNIRIFIEHIISCNNNCIIEDRFSISWPIINACPCTLELSQSLNGSGGSITHLQRGYVKLTAINNNISLEHLLELMQPEITPRSLLKREDELIVVLNAFSPAEFCEDVCRRFSQICLSMFKGLEGAIEINIETEESIHIHSVGAKKKIFL